MAPNTTEDQIARLRAEWAKAPFTARAVAGPYIGPLLDLLDTLNTDQRSTRAELDRIKAERERTGAAMRRMVETGQAVCGLPEWMLEELRPLVQEGPKHGA